MHSKTIAQLAQGLRDKTFSSEELTQAYALFHGMIVEYVKRNKQGKSVEITF